MVVDLDAIRARHREAYGDPATPMGAMRDVAALLAERDRLAATVERVRALHRPVEIEPSETICGHCSYRLPNGRYFGKVAEWPCPTIAAIEGTDS